MMIEAYSQRESGLEAQFSGVYLLARDRLLGPDVHVRSEAVLRA